MVSKETAGGRQTVSQIHVESVYALAQPLGSVRGHGGNGIEITEPEPWRSRKGAERDVQGTQGRTDVPTEATYRTRATVEYEVRWGGGKEVDPCITRPLMR